MSSIWQDPRSPHLTACFNAVVGLSYRQFKKTTGTSDKKLARRVADELEEAGMGRRTEAQIKAFLETIKDASANRASHKAFDFVLRTTTGRGLGTKTVRGFVERWLARTKGEVSPGSLSRYEQTARLLLESLGGKADQDIALVRQDDLARFRDEQAARVAASTANLMLKIVRIIFAAAEADGAITRNEAKHVKRLKSRTDSSRRAFTLGEVKNILAKCDDEWRSLVLFGFYTGARLGDIAGLTWQNVDLDKNELRCVTGKTGRPLVLPLSKFLRDHILEMKAGDDPKQPLHPRACAIAEREGRVGTLSRQFGEILAEAGLVKARSHHADKKKAQGKKAGGRSVRREASETSFHSLRHTAVSLLKNAGVSDAVARDLVGHESAEVSRLYTHIEDRVKLEALNRLPSLGG